MRMNKSLSNFINRPLVTVPKRLSLPKKLQISFFVAFGLLFVSQLFKPSQSANMTSVSATLSTPRLSFVGRLAATGNTVGSSQVTIRTSGAGISSYDTNQLQQDDPVRIGTAGALNSYVVSQTSSVSGAIFTTTAGLASGDADDMDFVIASQSAVLSVAFVTKNAVPNGRIQVLVPGAATAANDGIPDPGYFDFGTTAPSIGCPTDAGGYDFLPGVSGATASAVTVNGVAYHGYTCYYSGSGTVNQSFVSTPMTITSVINPTAVSGHTAGTADTNRIIVRNLDNTGNVIDSTAVSVGVIEAVKVTAEVPPQITFSIAGIAGGTSNTCGTGVSTDASFATTATKVPFGELQLSTFRIGAQVLTVTTNASDGYAVTAVENDQLAKDGEPCAGAAPTSADCIIDSLGDTPFSMSQTAGEDWASTTNKGFGYTVATSSATVGNPTLDFSPDVAIDNCAAGGNDCYRQFPDSSAGETATRLFQGTTVADTHKVNVCYKINVGPTTSAGSYENYITYRATATF